MPKVCSMCDGPHKYDVNNLDQCNKYFRESNKDNPVMQHEYDETQQEYY